MGGFLGDPVVKIPCFQGRSTGSIPGWGTEIPHASGAWSKKPKQRDLQLDSEKLYLFNVRIFISKYDMFIINL